MAMFLARSGASSPRLVVVKADPSLGTDPDDFAREYLETSGDSHPVLDAAQGPTWVSLLDRSELDQIPAFSESRFATDFLPRYGLRHAISLHLAPDSDEPDAALALFRSDGEPKFTDREKGFLRHSGPVLAHSFHCALEAEAETLDRSGRLTVLTDREYEIARLAALGSKNDQIAEKLHIAPGTVKTHLRNIYSKLDVDSRIHLALRMSGH